MNYTNKEYSDLSSEKTPKSPIVKDVCLAFLVGGLICTIGQFITNYYKGMGMDKIDAGAATSITLILIAAILTGLKLYEKIAKFAGAGTIVPITGFSNAITAPSMEFKSEGMVLGQAAKMFVIAGPVLVYGIGASIIYGLILFAFKLV